MSEAKTLSFLVVLGSPVEFRAGLWQRITVCWRGQLCLLGQGAQDGESVGSLSNVCCSAMEFSPAQSLNVLPYGGYSPGMLESGLIGDLPWLPDFSVHWQQLSNFPTLPPSRTLSASYENFHVDTNIYFLFLKPQIVFSSWR